MTLAVFPKLSKLPVKIPFLPIEISVYEQEIAKKIDIYLVT